MVDLTSDPAVRAFLSRQGMADAKLTPLPGDASARRYARVEDTGKMLMQDRNDPVGYGAFLRLSRHLSALGLSAPDICASDPEQGLALIEDFGTNTYSVRLAAGGDETALYTLAVDALLHLHGHPDAKDVDQPDYDLPVLLDELSIFSQWFAPAVKPGLDTEAFDQRFRTLWSDALEPLSHGPRTLVLRDFHVDNLMELSDREGVQRCGLLDFQDAVIGPAEYDLVSLLQDARRDLAPGLERAMLDHYAALAPHGGDGLLQRYYLQGAQRHTRIAGVFLRLNQRDGKSGYLRFMPRVLRQMQTAIDDAGLTEIAQFLDKELTGWRAATFD